MRKLWLAAGALVGMSVVPAWDQARASCVAPSLEVAGQRGVPTVVLHPGDEVTVLGQHFLDGCNDTNAGETPMGCSGGNDTRRHVPAMEDIELFILYGQPKMSQIKIGEADAGSYDSGRYGRIKWTFVVPKQVPSGPAVIKTSTSEPLDVTVRR